MKRIAIALAAFFSLLTLSLQASQAGVRGAEVTNRSVHPVWITLYFPCYGATCSRWEIIKGEGTYCLQPGQSRTFRERYASSEAAAEMKVRAQVMLRSDCKGPNVSDTYDIASGPEHLKVWVIQESEHRIYIKIINK